MRAWRDSSVSALSRRGAIIRVLCVTLRDEAPARGRGLIRSDLCVQSVADDDRLVLGTQAAYPDPVLYLVQGFDPVATRFRYAANPRLGSSEALRAAFANPFRISIDVSVEVGESQERRLMRQRLAIPVGDTLGRDAIRGRLAWRGPAAFAGVLRLSDSLKMSRAQTDSLERWNARHDAYRDSVYDALADALAARRGEYGGGDAERQWHDAIAAVQWDEWSFREALLHLLTPVQAETVFSDRAPAVSRLLLMNRKEAERYLARWFLSPR